MISIAILDDEQYNLKRTHSLVEQNLPNGIEASIFEASSPDELGDLAAHTQIDILITDIVMPDGQPNGIEMVDMETLEDCTGVINKISHKMATVDGVEYKSDEIRRIATMK